MSRREEGYIHSEKDKREQKRKEKQAIEDRTMV
jgi:hypothetical protein